MLGKLTASGLILVFAALVVSCSGSDVEEYVPSPNELCCHGNWELDPGSFDDDGDERNECAPKLLETLGDSTVCYRRDYYNVRVRPGETQSLGVSVAVLRDEAAAITWLTAYFPHETLVPYFDVSRVDDLPVGDDGGKTWEFISTTQSDYAGLYVAFHRDNWVAVVTAADGSLADRQIMIESVDEAIIDRLVGYE